MPDWYDRYRKGFHQEVYDELLAMQEQMDDPRIYQEAYRVMREMMMRVQYNVEKLISHFNLLEYLFGEGMYENPREKAYWEREAPVHKVPTQDTRQRIAVLEQLVGPLPLSLKCWYEEVGSVNLVGAFPFSVKQGLECAHGSLLDPLFLYSVETVIQMVTLSVQDGTWEEESILPLSPDCLHKYHYSGSGPYHIKAPFKAIDVPLLDEPHHTTLVNYLRICFQWGGFPGLEKHRLLSEGQLSFLIKDLLPF